MVVPSLDSEPPLQFSLDRLVAFIATRPLGPLTGEISIRSQLIEKSLEGRQGGAQAARRIQNLKPDSATAPQGPAKDGRDMDFAAASPWAIAGGLRERYESFADEAIRFDRHLGERGDRARQFDLKTGTSVPGTWHAGVAWLASGRGVRLGD